MAFSSQDVDASRLIRISEGLGRTSLVAARAAERLIRASRSGAFLTPAELYQYIDPVAVEKSFDQEQTRAVQRLLLVRNLLFILPLILTFAAIGVALILYQADVTSHPPDAGQSFLLLWENSFNTGNALFAASTIAVLDAGLFLVGGIVGTFAGLQRLRGRKQKQAVLEVLEEELERLANRSLNQLRELANPNANQNQALFQVNQALQESVKITQNVQVQIVQVVQQMGAFQESTASLSQNTKQVGQYLGDLGQNLVRLSQESSASAIRLEVAQNRNTDTLATLVTRIDGISNNLIRLAQEITDTWGKLEARLNQAVQVMGVTGVSLDRTTNSLDTIERSFTLGVAQIAQQKDQLVTAIDTIKRSFTLDVAQQTDQLVTTIQIARTSTQQLTQATSSLAANQQAANQTIQAMLQRLNEVIREAGSSAAALADLVDTESDTMRVASSLVTRFEIIQQLLGRLVALAGTGTRGDPFLQGLLGSEQEQQSLGINPLRILSLLEESGPQPMQVLMRQVQELMGQTPLDPAVLLDIITTFSDMDLVTLSGKSGNEQVKLTTLGKQVTGTLVSS